MKLVPLGPCGVLENVTALVGYENLCFMLIDDPGLAQDVFDAVGSRLLRMYEILVRYESVGAVVSNDDWGFKTQTMLAPADMRKYVFPWHKKIVAAAHAAGKPVILHSCGNPEEIIDDIIDDIKLDAKHSYEDNIVPVEQAYERWGTRIAIMGGLDVDFLCRSKPEEVYQRAKAMLERSTKKGGYALGSGNSIPEYIPRENYLAMISAAWG
jgi:uroporphyrinogen decarboxylase